MPPPALPLKPPLEPQLARSKSELPEGDRWSYEPKWDGFRAIAFVDGSELYLQSRNGKPLLRYFPELELPKGRYVVDGELVIFGRGRAAGVRVAAAAHPSGPVADRQVVGGDAGAVRGLRPAGAEDRSLLTEPFERGAMRSSRSPGRPAIDAVDARPVRGRQVVARRRGRGRKGSRRALPSGRANRHGQDQARAHDRLRRGRLAPGQGGRHARLDHPRPLRRRRAARGRPQLRLPRQAEAGAAASFLPPTNRASAAAASRAAGAPIATSSGTACARSWSARSASTTSATGASATAPSSSAGARTSRRASA